MGTQRGQEKTLEAYDRMFNATEKNQHLAQLRERVGVDPEHSIPQAFPDSVSEWKAIDVMKFAVMWDLQFTANYEAWSAQRPSDYHLLNLEQCLPPAEDVSILQQVNTLV